MKTWYLKFPTYQYNENAVQLAKEAGFRIIDAKYADGQKSDAGHPVVTVKGESPKVIVEDIEQDVEEVVEAPKKRTRKTKKKKD